MLRLPRIPRLAAALACLSVLALPLRAQTVFTVDTTVPAEGLLAYETIINAGVTVTGSEGGYVFAFGTTINGTLIVPTDFLWWVNSGSFSINHALHLNGGTLYTLDASINGGTATISSGTWNLNALNASGGTYVQTGGSVASSSSSFGLASITGGSLSTGLLALSGPTTFGAATITTTQIARANPAATLSINGTTIRAAAFQSSFFDGFAGSSVSLGAAGLTFDSNGLNAGAPNIFTGTGGITKIGAGTLGLSGANTYSGATQVNTGTLWLSGAASLPAASALAVAPGATVTFGLGGAGDFTATQALSVIAGSTFQSGSFYGFDTTHAAGGTATLAENLTVPLPLVKTGSGTLVLTGDNTGTGAITVAGGNLAAGHDSALGATGAPVTLASGGAFQPTTSFTSNRTFSFAGGAIDTPSGINFSLNTPFAGTGPFIKTGAGVLTLTVANTASAATIVSAGTLRPGAANFLSPTSAIYLNNGTLDLNGYNQTVPNLSSYNIATTLFDPGTVQLGGATLTNLNLLGDAWHGDVTGTGNYIFQGTGPYTWTGTNTFTGTLTIATGTLTAGATNTLSPHAAVSISSGATLALDTYSQSIASLSGAGTVSLGSGTLTTTQSGNTTFSGPISGTGALTKAGTGTLTLSGNNTYTGGSTFENGTTVIPVGASLSHAASTLFVGRSGGAGTLEIAGGAVTSGAGAVGYFGGFTGTVALSAGSWTSNSLEIGRLGVGTVHLTGGSATTGLIRLGEIGGSGSLRLDGGTLDTAGIQRFSSTSSLTAGGGTVRATADSATFLSGFGAGSATLNAGGLTFDTNGFAVTVPAEFTGTGGLTKTGLGLLTLTGANTYSGDTTVLAGTLRLGATNALSAASPLTLAIGATLDLNNYATSLGKLDGSGNIVLGSANLTIAQSSNSAFTGGISGTGGLTKSGAGTLTLSGTHTFSGSTVITGGQLAVTGSASASAFSVDAGGTLSGTGTLGALTVNSGGTVSPGASPGTLSTGATTFNSGGSLVWEINNATGLAGTNWDLLSISGSLTVASTSGNPFALRLTSLLANNTAGQVINFNSAQNYSYTIATAGGGIFGFSATAFSLDTSGFTNPLNGGSFTLSTNGNNLNLNFTASAIPEPSTYAAILGAAALLLAAHRRKNRSRSS